MDEIDNGNIIDATLNKFFDVTPLNIHTAAVCVAVRHFSSSLKPLFSISSIFVLSQVRHVVWYTRLLL